MRHNEERWIRAVDRLAEHPTCCLECEAETAGAKPYCTRHVTRMPYVANLLAKLDQPCLVEAA